jgi:hypothetical protein
MEKKLKKKTKKKKPKVTGSGPERNRKSRYILHYYYSISTKCVIADDQ